MRQRHLVALRVCVRAAPNPPPLPWASPTPFSCSAPHQPPPLSSISHQVPTRIITHACTCMHMHTHVSMYRRHSTHMHMHSHAHSHACTQVPMHTACTRVHTLCAHTCAHAHTCILIYMRTLRACIHMHIHAHTHAPTQCTLHEHTCTCMHPTHMHMHMHAHTGHTCIHTGTHTCLTFRCVKIYSSLYSTLL